jgi:PAS domain S-box-containing protein
MAIRTRSRRRAPELSRTSPHAWAHRVQFYEHDAFLVDSVAGFVGGALGAGGVAITIATAVHRERVEAQLRARAIDVDAAAAQRRYLALDAAETLAKFMVEEWPDERRFTDVLGGIIAAAAAAHPHATVHVFGEMVALLWADGKHDAAVRLEKMWNDLARTMTFSLMCGYAIGSFARDMHRAPFVAICDAHDDVVPAESYTALATPAEQGRAIAQLQQRASTEEGEAAERERLAVSRAQLAAIVDSSDDAIIGKTLDGTVTSWNAGAERIFGYTGEEMIGQPISKLMPPERTEDFSMILAAIRRGERVEHFETQRVHKDGRRIHVSLTVSPIRDGSGRIIGASKVARDVSDRKRADAEREELLGAAECARAEAEAANRAKDEFLAMLSHELRNPLSAVQNAIVTAHLDGNRRERALEIARRQADHLGRLVDDLLDVARIAQGKIALEIQRVRLAAIVEHAVEATRPIIEQRGHELQVSVARDGLYVDGDPVRLEQVIGNLITNAAKYTEPGGRIEITGERDNEDAVLRVRDNGVGIAPEVLPRVFDLFTQADRSLDRGQGGLGIGLTVVRRLVELHGGRVEARSDGIGHGTEVIVRLPGRAGAREDSDSLRTTTAVRPCARVLLVEDNADIAETLAMLMELLGHEVVAVHDGEAALEALRARVPQVMLIDIGLPGMDGYEVARRVRQDPAFDGIALVALTGYGHEADRQQAFHAGFDHHLVKPIEPKALHALVTELATVESVANRRAPTVLH